MKAFSYEIETKTSNSKLVIIQGSVLKCKAFALVNATNQWLIGTDGVDKAFDVEGGIEEEREKILPNEEGIKVPEGEIVVTPAGSKLNAKYIIHACGPDYGLREHIEFKELDMKLKGVYKKAIQKVVSLGGKDIGFCLISAGAFAGFRSMQDIIQIGVESILEELEGLKDFTVYLYVYTKKEAYLMEEVYKKLSLKHEEERKGEKEEREKEDYTFT